jgi:hypothetical protein
VVRDYLIHGLRILLGNVIFQLLRIGTYNPVGAILHKHLRLLSDPIAGQHGHNLLAKLGGQIACFAQQLQGYGLNHPIPLLGKYKNVFIIRFIHSNVYFPLSELPLFIKSGTKNFIEILRISGFVCLNVSAWMYFMHCSLTVGLRGLL